MRRLPEPVRNAASVKEGLVKWLKQHGSSSRPSHPARIQIVSPELCGKFAEGPCAHVFMLNISDDILERLGPTLPQPHTCDIIDLNPGVCLWSSKVHDLLKPHRHVLVEPDLDRYSPFIDSLLASSPAFLKVTSLTEVFDANLHQPSALFAQYEKYGHPSINPSLLIIANTSSSIIKARDHNYGGPSSKYMIHAYYTSMFRKDSSLHKYGLTRMLAWIPEKDKKIVIPRTVVRRSRLTVRTELAAQATEVAGGSSYQHASLRERRHYDVDMRSEARVGQRTRHTYAPQNRQPVSLMPFADSLNPNMAGLLAMQQNPTRRTWAEKLLRLEQMYQAGHVIEGGNRTRGSSQKVSEEWKRLGYYRSKQRVAHNFHVHCDDLVRRQVSLDKGLLPDSTEKNGPADAQELQRAIDELRNERDGLALIKKERVTKGIDDHRAFTCSPPVLQWDRREFEPLQAQDGEFYSPTRRALALLDLMPRSDLVSRLDSEAKRVCFDYVLDILFDRPACDMRAGLERLVQGGVDEFIERVPRLQDPLKGGGPDLSDIRPRALSVEVFIDLAIEFERWPFRPPIAELRAAQEYRLE